MAVRQYVGARYVPKFADPVAWQAGTSYEALTIVTYNNSSYTSKIPVPATVGNPADNDEYWALTGNYNAQVEAYREETVAVQENLNEEIQNRENAVSEEATARNNQIINYSQKLIRHRFFVFLGDSYSDPNYAGQNSIVTHCCNYMGITSAQYQNLAVSGAKLVSSDTNTYIHQIQNVTLAVSDNLVTDIVLAAGANDYGNNFGTNNTALTTLTNYIKSRFTNANIWIFMVGFNDSINAENQIRSNVITAYNSASQNTTACFPYVGLDMLDSRLINETGFHPNEQGATLLGIKIANALLGGNPDNFISWLGNGDNYYITLTPVDGITEASGDTLVSTAIHNGRNYVRFRLHFTASTPFNVPNDQRVTIGTFNTYVGLPREAMFPCTALIQTTGKSIIPFNCTAFIIGKTLAIQSYDGLGESATSSFTSLWLHFGGIIDNH